jgi:putative transposase
MQFGAGALSETHMPRRLRVHVPGGFYHVTLRGNHRRAIFIEGGGQRVLNAIVARGDYPWSSHHTYVGVRHEPWVTTAFALEMFSVDRLKGIAAYLEFVGSKDAAEWSPDKQVSMQDERERKHQGFVPEFTTPRASRQSLEQLIAEACARFEVAPDALISTVRNRYITKVRAWIAYQARVRHICPLSEVARALDRHEATLREAIRRYPHEMT